MTNAAPRIRHCQCGCGRSWDMNDLSYPQRSRKYAIDCPTSPGGVERARRQRMAVPLTCACGVCGLQFLPVRSRKYAPDCPTQEEIQRAQQRRAYAAAQRNEVLPARSEPLKPPKLRERHCKRCNTCEAMPWRRPEGGRCPECGGPHREESNDGMRERLYASMRNNNVA